MVVLQRAMNVLLLHMLFTDKEKQKHIREVSAMCLSRPQKLCNFLEWREYKIVYKRYASLFFITCVDRTDNELITLEVIHQFVEVLDRYFGNVVGFCLFEMRIFLKPSICARNDKPPLPPSASNCIE